MMNAFGNPSFEDFILTNVNSKGLFECSSQELIRRYQGTITENQINLFKILKFYLCEMMDVGNYNEFVEGTLIDPENYEAFAGKLMDRFLSESA